MRTIKPGERSSFQIRNANIAGFLIKLYGIGSAVNTTPVDVPYQARITAKLSQKGFNGTILDGTITGLAKGCAKKVADWLESDTECTRVVVTAAAAVVGESEWIYRIIFPQVINLNDDDVMDVELEMPSGTLTDHNTSTSYLGIKEIAGIGAQMFIPIMKEYVLPALETRHELFLGDNILRAVYVGAAAHTPADDGLDKVEIYSDRRQYVYDEEEIHMEGLLNEFEGAVVIEQEEDEVKIVASMDGILNAAGDLRLIVTSYFINSLIVADGTNRKNKHINYIKEKIQ